MYGVTASVIGDRPLSTFMAGLLVIVLTAPVVTLLAVTVIGLAALPVLFGALLIGWMVGWPALTTIAPGQAAMKPNTALALVLVGLAGAQRHRPPDGRLPRILAALAAAETPSSQAVTGRRPAR